MSNCVEFEVIIYDSVDLIDVKFSEAGEFIADLLASVTGFQGWVSPCHAVDDDNLKPHYHAILRTDTRDTSIKSIRKALLCTGLNFRGGQTPFILGIKKRWSIALAYLTHETVDSRHKEQFPDGTMPFPVNYPQSAYVEQIFEVDYQDTILRLIDVKHCSNARALFDVVRSQLPEFAPLVWRDLNKWDKLLYVPPLK